MSSRDSAVTNFNQEFEPPDQGLCVGNGEVLEMVNSAYTLYHKNGSVITGPFNVNGPFDEGLKEFTSDPRCYYDSSTNTWFAVILFINSNSTASHIDIAVNTGDPTGLWTNYQIDTTASNGAGHSGCPCFGDQPTLGIDKFNLYVTTDEFSIVGPQFNGAQIYAISKQDLVAGAARPHFVHFDNLNIGGTVASTVQPAITNDADAPAEYFLNSLDPTGTFDQRIGVWALTHRERVTNGGTPTLSKVVLGSEAYGYPPPATQMGSSSTIDSGDDRMQQTQEINGHVWGELGTALTIPGDAEQRAGAAWFDVKPQLSNGVLNGASMARQGYVGVKGNYFLYPALQAAPNGTVTMVGTLTGPTLFPSAAYTQMPAGSPAFGPVKIAAAGTTHYDPNSTRWGDYSWAVLDPSLTAVWMATEYIPPAASQTPDRAANWGTRVMEVATG